eukprot:GHVS01082165.1.p1 GENE.GHVS01082165.1~~GHVS01082165.1.p1  ORF type:complete len:984 (+),score=110.39 GHVS01082165.1:1533-4484(+)
MVLTRLKPELLMQRIGQTIFYLFFALLWCLCLHDILLLLIPSQSSYYLSAAQSLHPLNSLLAVDAVRSKNSFDSLSLASWLSSGSDGAESPATASGKWISSEESIGEGVLFFVLPDGNIDSCEETNSTSLIEFMLRGYSEMQLPPPPRDPIAMNESVADLTISRRQVSTSLRKLQSLLDPETPSTTKTNVGLLLTEVGTQKTTTSESALSALFRSNSPPNFHQKPQLTEAAHAATAPIRSLAPSFSQDSGLPLISSYHYMTPQRARTGWTDAVAPYGIDGTSSGGASVPLVSALRGTTIDLPPAVAYSAAAAPEKLGGEEPRLSGLQIADRQYTDQMDGQMPSRRLEGVLGSLLQGGIPLMSNIASALTSALNGVLSPQDGVSPLSVLSSLVATAANELRPVDSSSRLADIFPPRVRANGNEETATINDMASSVDLMGQAFLPPLLEVAGPLVSEVGRLLLQQAGPIGSHIVQSIVKQATQAINRGDPSLRRGVESIVGMAEEFLRPMLESTIQDQLRAQYSSVYRAQLVDDMNEVMRSNLAIMGQSISDMLSKELPQQMQESMAATMTTVMRRSLRQALDDTMPRSRETASNIQQEVREWLADPSSFVSADTQALLKEISRATNRSDRQLDNRGDYLAETIVGQSEQRARRPTDSEVISREMSAREIREAAAEERRRQLEDEELRNTKQLNGGEVGGTFNRNRQRAVGYVNPVLGDDVAEHINTWLTQSGDERQKTDPVVSETPAWDLLTELYRNTANQALRRFSVEQQRNAVGQTGQQRNAPAEELSTYERAMLNAHNAYRKNAVLRPVQWDGALATFVVDHMKSQDAYKNCKMEHSKQSQRDSVGVFTNVGENLYTGWGGTIFPKAERIVEAWYDEINCYRYGPIGAPCTKNPNPQCALIAGFKGNNPLTGHFTQLMWSSVTHIGCGAIECSTYKGPGKKFFGGCSYGSTISGYGGNMVGEYPFDARAASRLGLSVGTCN